MRTVKSNLLDHIAEDIVRNGDLFLCDAGMYEYSYIISSVRMQKAQNDKALW